MIGTSLPAPMMMIFEFSRLRSSIRVASMPRQRR
jgi:hypothetical protein